MDDELEGCIADARIAISAAHDHLTRIEERARKVRDEITTTERAAAAWTHRTRVEVLERERDEARAGRALAEELACAVGVERDILRRERDEARAEAERLRARLHRCAQCSAEECAVAACEGDEYPLCGPCATRALREARADAAAALAHTDREVGEILRTLPEALRLAAEDEREACAVICDALGDAAEVERDACCDDRSRSLHAGRMHGADECARAIRARGAGGGM